MWTVDCGNELSKSEREGESERENVRGKSE